jgi:hypothetical protein
MSDDQLHYESARLPKAMRPAPGGKHSDRVAQAVLERRMISRRDGPERRASKGPNMGFCQ